MTTTAAPRSLSPERRVVGRARVMRDARAVADAALRRLDPVQRGLVPLLARWTISGHLIHQAHTEGRAAALSELAESQHGGTGDRERWAYFEVQGRTIRAHRAEVRFRDPNAVAVPAAAVLGWALARFTTDDLDHLAGLVAARKAGFAVVEPDLDAWRRQTFTPSQVTAEERARIARGHQMMADAERAIEAFVRARLDTTEAHLPDPGEQIALFDPTAH